LSFSFTSLGSGQQQVHTTDSGHPLLTSGGHAVFFYQQDATTHAAPLNSSRLRRCYPGEASASLTVFSCRALRGQTVMRGHNEQGIRVSGRITVKGQLSLI